MSSPNDAGKSADETECHIDTQHLQGLPGILTAKLDLVLLARDGSQQVGFPVHQVIVAQHSPVLSSALEKAQLNDKYFAAQSQTLPYIPMLEDCSLAIRAALAFMYNTSNEVSHWQTAAECPWIPQISLKMSQLQLVKSSLLTSMACWSFR